MDAEMTLEEIDKELSQIPIYIEWWASAYSGRDTVEGGRNLWRHWLPDFKTWMLCRPKRNYVEYIKYDNGKTSIGNTPNYQYIKDGLKYGVCRRTYEEYKGVKFNFSEWTTE